MYNQNRSKEMRRLQKKLIPVNFIVCVLCIVAAVSLFFTPLLKIDFGKILNDETIIDYAVSMFDKKDGETSGGGIKPMDGLIESGDVEGEEDESGEGEENESGEGEEGGTSGGNSDSIMEGVDASKILKPVLKEVCSSIKGDLSVSVFNITKITFSKNPGEALVDMLADKDGLIDKVVVSLVGTMKNIGSNQEVTSAINDIVIDMVATQLANNLPESFGDVDKEELTTTIKKLDEAKTETEAVSTIMEFIDSVQEEKLEGEDRENFEKQISDLYKETVKHTNPENIEGQDNFSVEAMICVMASGMVGEVGDLNGLLDKLLGGANEQEKEDGGEAYAKMRAELTEDPEESAPGESAPEGSGEESKEEKEVTYYTTYEGLFGSLTGDLNEEELSTKVRETLKTQMGGFIEKINETNDSIHLFMIIFGVLAFFIGLWVILFLFAFFHMLAKNKRFTMWYVKLFAPYPAIIFWFVPTVIKLAIKSGNVTINGVAATAEQLNLLSAILGGVSSMAWISGLCYLLLWAISILWAFPIKHKIRRLKREMRDYD